LVEDRFCVVHKDADGKVVPLTTHSWLNSGGSETLYQYGQHNSEMQLNGIGFRSRTGRFFDTVREGMFLDGELHGFGREIVFDDLGLKDGSDCDPNDPTETPQ